MRKSDDSVFLWSPLLIAAAAAVLCAVGLLILESAGSGKSNPHEFLQKQAVFMCVALAAGTITAFVDLQKLKKLAVPIAVVCAILLVLVLIPQIGKEVNGSRRWLSFGPIAVQPSDFAKIAVVLLLASFLHDNQRRVGTVKDGIVKPLALAALFCFLIIAEPDFGTCALCGLVAVSMIFIAGCPKGVLAGLLAFGTAVLGVLVYLSPVRRARVLAFLDIENTKLEGSYQLYQAILGFGAGGVRGAGIGRGRQQLSFLPEAHTDFIFAIVGEEMGLFFTLLVVAMFLVIFFAGIFLLKRAKNKFEFYMAFGAILMITYQAMFNMCVVTGLMPTKGISLPFISLGGSNLLVMFVFLGIIFNCARTWRKPTKIKAVEYE